MKRASEYPALARLEDYLDHYATATPNAEATIFGSHRSSYRQLAHQVNSCAAALAACGVQSGDRVAMLCTTRPEFLVVVLACARVGAIWIGLNPRYKLPEIEHVMRDATPRVLFSLLEFEGRSYEPEINALAVSEIAARHVVTLGGEIPGLSTDWSAFMRPPETFRRPPGELQDIAAIVYTSGSTGRPKGAMLSHRAIISAYLLQLALWCAQPLRNLNNLPINHIGGLGDLSLCAVIGGGCTVYMERFDPLATLEAIERERITLMLQVPAQYQHMMSHARFAEIDLSSLQVLAFGGATVSTAFVKRLMSIGAPVYTYYGLTETVAGVTFTPPGATLVQLAETIGAADPEFEVDVFGADGVRMGSAEAGEIRVRGSCLMSGYWNRPEATREAIDAQGWLHTGDVGVRNPDGSFRLVGRLRDMFKSGGYNVYPAEIENVLEQHPDVEMAAVVAAPDPLYAEVGHAFLATRVGSSLDAQQLRQFCSGSLSNYKIPKRFEVLERLPLLPNGKIDKNSLRALAARQIGAV